MYKLLLSWRYLCTRYIALASIISVTLGVATLIVVNSVMAGFTEEMHKRLHGILSDIVFESHGLDGFPDPEWQTGILAHKCLFPSVPPWRQALPAVFPPGLSREDGLLQL